uniref:hypothetical protein n=1 Tax=Brevibacillus laterosporus TaxID=1465 RepID=UPI0034D5BA6A
MRMIFLIVPVIDPATEKVRENYEYDKSENLASYTDQKGNTRKYTYTPFYELDTLQVLSGSSRDGEEYLRSNDTPAPHTAKQRYEGFLYV